MDQGSGIHFAIYIEARLALTLLLLLAVLAKALL
jgi:hypothetical protein